MKWFNPYRWIGAAVISLNVFGQACQYAEPVNNACWIATGTGLGTIHPGLEVALRVGVKCPEIATEIEIRTNQYWLESVYSVDQSSPVVMDTVLDKDTVLLTQLPPLPKIDLNLVD